MLGGIIFLSFFNECGHVNVCGCIVNDMGNFIFWFLNVS